MKKSLKYLLIASLLSFLVTACVSELPKTNEPFKLQPVEFNHLPGWTQDKQAPAFYAFQNSCRSLTGSFPKKNLLGSPLIPLNENDWRPVCQTALKIKHISDVEAREFFEKWFKPYAVLDHGHSEGLFTGYYLPEIQGSSKKTKYFSMPLWGRPKDLIYADLGNFNPQWQGRILFGKIVNGSFRPYHTSRKEIDKGALDDKAKIIAWAHPIDRFFLQIQGSGLLKIDRNPPILVGYDGANGSPYTAIGKVLVARGALDKKTLSMTQIRQWLFDHPEAAQEVMEQDASFVFFKKLPQKEPLGTLQTPLTPGRSIAVDRKVIPMGLPLWIATSLPKVTNPQELSPFNRLFIAQDTGGAIQGIVRGDLYWGSGPEAEFLASHLKNHGRYWLFLPKNAEK